MSLFRRLFSPAILLVAGSLIITATGVAQKKAGGSRLVERGRHIVEAVGCKHCHSPKIMTPMGPISDSTKYLSGHPADEQQPQVPAGLLGPQSWGAVVSNDFTVWVGPWGTSYTANLTPDKETGLGSWTPDMFVKAMRTGKHMGEGRQILPPMPWDTFGKFSDDELKAIFAYLQSLPPIANAVPDPLSPAGEKIPTPHMKGK